MEVLYKLVQMETPLQLELKMMKLPEVENLLMVSFIFLIEMEVNLNELVY